MLNEHGRLRSGWRFLIFQLSFVVFGTAFGAGFFFLLKQLPVFYDAGSVLSFVVPNVILFVPAVFCGGLCGKFLEGLPFRALGLWFTKNWLKDLIFGLIAGAISITLAVLIAILFGGMRLELNQSAGSSAIGLTLLVSFVVFVVGAIAEEAYFRGYILQTFARARLAWLAIVFTSLFFASAHLNNQNADWISTTNTALAGVWFGIAYLKTRNLWFPFGIHLMWNWLQGAFFGIPVSGITSLTTAPFMNETEKGAKLLTGGDYGIEGGIACTIAIIASGALIWFAPFIKPTAEMLALTGEENTNRERVEDLKTHNYD
ncbi:MAG TPA: type II CAAX endopeptidase family protein [Pyrinomonadaceae bacterium]|nr:type II CAAX endopeptidase family protein [Pyrinomonadaceae bacterium]